MATGRMENHPASYLNGGVCGALHNKDLKNFVELFRPESYPHAYWGFNKPYPNRSKSEEIAIYGFNDLRQNMLLLLAAMNNEL
jgi:hypothetical protein